MSKFSTTGQYFRICTDVDNDTWDTIPLKNTADDCYYDSDNDVSVKTKIDSLKSEIDTKQDASTAITIDNIANQTVKYAISAGSATNATHATSADNATNATNLKSSSNSWTADTVKTWFEDRYTKTETDTKLDEKLNTSGGTMTGGLSMGGNNLTGVYGLYGKDKLYLKSSNDSNSVVIGGEALNVVHNSGSAPEPWADVLCDHVRYHGGLVNDSYSKVKKNIKKINDKEAKKILEVPIYTFDYINGYGNNAKNQIGTLYDDIKDIIPNATYVPDGWDEETFDIETANPMEDYVPGVSYIELIPYLIRMVQIQQEEINELKEKVSALESK